MKWKGRPSLRQGVSRHAEGDNAIQWGLGSWGSVKENIIMDFVKLSDEQRGVF